MLLAVSSVPVAGALSGGHLQLGQVAASEGEDKVMVRGKKGRKDANGMKQSTDVAEWRKENRRESKDNRGKEAG